MAKTEGVTAIKGGQKAFSGKNEELKTEHFDGDANNFTHTTGESSNMVLNENIVTGDDKNRRTESKSSSVSHTTKVIRSSNNATEFGGNTIDDNIYQHSNVRDQDSRRESTNTVNSASHFETKNAAQHNVSEKEKLSQDPAVVQEALHLAQQPGTILSRKVERANESTNMIIEKKELSDGTIVTTKKYEPINSEHVNIQAVKTVNSNIQNDIKTTNENQTEIVNQSNNSEITRVTPNRNEEAFRLSEQSGNIISRDVKMADAKTRLITEMKELNDGTIVTSKRYEKVSNDISDDNIHSEHLAGTSLSTTNQIFKTSRDKEAFRLAQQPGKILSRDITMANPTTRQIIEKKELHDGTIVTTKHFEFVDSSNDTKSSTKITKEHQINDEFTKSLRNETKTTKGESIYKASRDEEAFRMAEQPEKVISRDVTMADPTTRQIVEKKELHDGTIITTKRFEKIENESTDLLSNHAQNIQSVKKTYTTLRSQPKTTQNEDISTQRQVVEETVTKKIYDTSCQCPTGKNKHDHKTREYINSERKTDNFDSTEIKVKRDDTKKLNNELNRKEEMQKSEQKRIDEQIKSQQELKITRELGFDSAHKAFANSLRCVTPPLDKSSFNRVDHRSPSRETNNSRYSSSIITTKKSSSENMKKNDDVKNTNPLDCRPSSKSSEKYPSIDRRQSAKSPDKHMSNEHKVPSKSPEKQSVVANKDKKPITTNYSKSSSPQKFNSDSTRRTSPLKIDVKNVNKTVTAESETILTTINHHISPSKATLRSISPRKSQTKEDIRSKSPQKNQPETFPHESLPTKSTPTHSRASSPQKSNSSLPRDFSSVKSRETDTDENDTTKELLTTTIKIDNIDKTINDLKIIQTIDSKNMSATTSVSDLEYISASDHKKLITDLDNEDIEVSFNIQNVNELDGLQIKTTVSEVVDENITKTPKNDKKPFNRSETFEERAKKLIGVSSDNETKDVPNHLKPTKASQAPVKGSLHRVSEIRERKAQIEEIEKSTTKKRKSLTNTTADFVLNENINSLLEKSPTCKQPSTDTKKPNRSDVESTKISGNTTECTKHNYEKSSEQKKIDCDKIKLSRTSVDSNTVRSQRKCSRSPTREKTPETHITVAQITISPSRGITSKTVSKTTTVQSNKHLKVAPHIKLLKQATDVSSTELESDRDTDQELIRNIEKTGNKSTRKKLLKTRKDTAPVNNTTNEQEREKVTRTFSAKIINNEKRNSVTKNIRESPKKESKRPVKCITTKTINLTNNNGTTLHSNTLDDVEININVQQAKSSREPSPYKVIPIPVQTDEDVNEENILHPNKVTEPEDDVKKTKANVRNVPIFQEDTKQFVGLEITELATEKGHTIIEEEESEETERIINSSTLEKADRKRNSIQIDPLPENDDDEHSHLLSVSQKVNKFNETVEELKNPKSSTQLKKNDHYKLEDVPDEVVDDSRLSQNKKVLKFTKVTDETSIATSVPNKQDSISRSIDEVDENLKDDECLLSVSDKVNKFITKAEKIGSTAPQKSPELVKNVMKQTSKHVRDKIDNITETFINNEKVSTKEKSADITLKSTEAIKKAREVFACNSTATRDLNRQNDILSRPSVFETKRTPTATRKVIEEQNIEKIETVHEKTPDRQSPLKETEAKSSSRRGSSDRTPIYMKDQVSTKKDLFEKRISSSRLDSETFYHKPLSPQGSVEEKRKSLTEETHTITRKISNSDKHYMQHTVASLEHVANTDVREAELHRTARLDDYDSRRDSLRSTSKQPSESREILESPKTPTKFGVELKKMDSFKTQMSRKVSIGNESVNIEEIFELEELQRLLEIVVGYEQRRRIRSQIRLVKKKLEETKLKSDFKSRMVTAKKTSRIEPITKRVTERKTSEKIKIPRETESIAKNVTTKTVSTLRISGDNEPKVTSKTTRTTTTSSSPRAIIETISKDNKRKVSESVVKTARKTSATSNTQKSNTLSESKTETDCITSSYGVGPTENGMPLFGLKALKKKSPAVVESKSK